MLAATLERYRQVISYREDDLFLKFLPRGYEATTLSGVPDYLRGVLLQAKVSLGMYITLVDDFADNPKLHRPDLLNVLHRVPFHWEEVRQVIVPAADREVIKLARHLCEEILVPLSSLPHARKLHPIFHFDFEQFLNANWFSSLITGLPELANETEARRYGTFNMGMVVSGMMDVMSLPNLHWEELGAIRRILHLGQRIGRICNVEVTFDRELIEGDKTNECLVSSRDLLYERATHFEELQRLAPSIRSFSVLEFVQGLKELQSLHHQLRGHL